MATRMGYVYLERHLMKNLKEKFGNKIQFVKPLYKKVRPNKNVTKHSYVVIDFDNTTKVVGHGVTTDKVIHKNSGKNNKIEEKKKFCKNTFSEVKRKRINNYVNVGTLCDKRNMLSDGEKPANDNVAANVRRREAVEILDHNWLRVYPAPSEPDEGLSSILFRWLACQIGLTTFLCLWTAVWVFVINHFEGPFEQKVSEEFKTAQNQLVIDLATELRQITPISPKWKMAIENRIEEQRRLTISAVAKGARPHPGRFWDLAGTFLFSIYVMTALGFGAPVPHTLWGRTASLSYAVVSVPMQICLMVHLSTCIVVYSERFIIRLRICLHKSKLHHENALENKTESPSTSRSSDLRKPTSRCCSSKICRLLNIIWIGRGVPLCTVLYYLLGATCFGVLRRKEALEVIMFPLEFTTTGGLDHVEGHVRVLYGFYVQGAMVHLSCGLAALKRRHSGAADKMAAKYRLYVSEASLPKLR